MKLEYRVHTISNETVSVPTQVEGETVNAAVPCLAVEFVPVKGRHGSFTLRFTGSQIAEARELYTQDRVLTFDVAAADAGEKQEYVEGQDR